VVLLVATVVLEQQTQFQEQASPMQAVVVEVPLMNLLAL
jgi:hypothetical protein